MEEYVFTLLYPSLEETQSGSLREFLHKNLQSPMEETLQNWKRENHHFRYFPVWTDIPGVDREFSYKKWNPKNIMEVTFRHSHIVGTLNSILYIFSLGIIPGFQDNTWYVDLKIYDSQGKEYQIDVQSQNVSEIRSSLFFPLWLTGIKSDYKPIMQEILKKTLLKGRAYIQDNNIAFQTRYESYKNSLPILDTPISMKNVIIECNIHLQEKGTPNIISYHPPVGQGGLCRWSVVFYNHTKEEIQLNADNFRLVLIRGTEIKPLSEFFVRTKIYNQGASTSNNGIRKLDSRIRVPSYSKGMEDATLGIAYPFTNYSFYFPYQKLEKIRSMKSFYNNQPVGIHYRLSR